MYSWITNRMCVFNQTVKVKGNKRCREAERCDCSNEGKEEKVRKKNHLEVKVIFKVADLKHNTQHVCAAKQHKQAFNCETREAFLYSLSLHLQFLHAAHVLPPWEAINRIKCPWPWLLVESVENWLKNSQHDTAGKVTTALFGNNIIWSRLCFSGREKKPKHNSTWFFLQSSYSLLDWRLTGFLRQVRSHTVTVTIPNSADGYFVWQDAAGLQWCWAAQRREVSLGTDRTPWQHHQN